MIFNTCETSLNIRNGGAHSTNVKIFKVCKVHHFEAQYALRLCSPLRMLEHRFKNWLNQPLLPESEPLDPPQLKESFGTQNLGHVTSALHIIPNDLCHSTPVSGNHYSFSDNKIQKIRSPQKNAVIILKF